MATRRDWLHPCWYLFPLWLGLFGGLFAFALTHRAAPSHSWKLLLVGFLSTMACAYAWAAFWADILP